MVGICRQAIIIIISFLIFTALHTILIVVTITIIIILINNGQHFSFLDYHLDFNSGPGLQHAVHYRRGVECRTPVNHHDQDFRKYYHH